MRKSVRLLLAGLVLAGGQGCSRKFFRERADEDVAGVITQKNHFPAWAVKNWYVYPHPDARYADPYNPDRPPYPADDYAARLLSPNPQHPTRRTGTGRYDGEGYLRVLSQWDAENRAADGVPVGANTAGTDRIVAGRMPSRNATLPGTLVLPTGLTAGKSTTDRNGWLVAKPPRVVVTQNPTKPQLSPVVSEDRTPEIVQASAQEKDSLPEIPNVPVLASPRVLPEGGQQPEKLPIPQPADPKADPKAAAPSGQFPSVQTLLAMGGSADEYLRALASNQQGYRLRIEQAVELGLLNSREFQDRREDLYLTALPVTLERFNFAAQAFFTEQVFRDFLGSDLGGSRLWSVNTTTGFGKRFATGGTLLVRAANQVVLNLGAGRPDIAVSNLSLTFFQPFLRGGGFAVSLENLTGAERNLLYAMRSYARFRKIFYVAITAGGNITNNPYGLQGLAPNLGRGIGGNLTSPSVGYLPLLLQSAVIANQQKNVTFLGQLLKLYQAFREGGQQSDLQVGQVEVQLLNSRGQLLGQGGGGGSGIRGFLDALDAFKLQLGLPVTVGLDLDNSPLRPIRDQLARFEDLYADLAQFETVSRQYNLADPIADFRPRWRKLLTDSELVRDTAFAKGIGARWDAWSSITEEQFATRLAELRKQRTALLDAKVKRQTEGKPEPEAEVRRLATLESELDLAAFERAVRTYETRAWLKLDGPARALSQASAFRDVLNAFYQVGLEARNERLFTTRTQWPSLPSLPVSGLDVLAADLDDAYLAGVESALSNRLDLMNARGQVVDAYRQIAVQANSLQGVLNVQYDYTAATPAGESRPFAFSGGNSRQTLTFRGELPLVRRAERNNYRAALIGYQRQRRTLMAFEDNIANDVRNDIRELRTLAQLYRIQQRVVELGYSQVDNAQAILLAPPAPNAGNDAGSAAALTQQVLDAQSRLLNAQNALYNLWVTYLTARMNFYLDLELMQLDDRGVWCDEQATGTDSPQPGTGRPERIPAPQPVAPPVGK